MREVEAGIAWWRTAAVLASSAALLLCADLRAALAGSLAQADVLAVAAVLVPAVLALSAWRRLPEAVARWSPRLIAALVLVLLYLAGEREPGAIEVAVHEVFTAAGLATLLIAHGLLGNPVCGARRRQCAALMALMAVAAGIALWVVQLLPGRALQCLPSFAALSGSACAIALLLRAGVDVWPMSLFVTSNVPPAGVGARSNWVGVFAFAALIVAGIVASGVSYIGGERARAQAEARDMVSTVADLKVAGIAAWFRERRGDAELLTRSALASDELARVLEGSADADEVAAVAAWMREVVRGGGYRSVLLFAADGSLAQAHPSTTRLDADVGRLAHQVAIGHTPLTEDLHFSDDGRAITLDFWIPIGEARGALLLRVDPQDYLYPALQTWPVPSASAETLLIRRDGDDVLFLNELRHRSGTALRLRLPLSGSIAVPALAAIHGQRGVVEGLDYRGVPVLATVRSVPGTPWFMVAKVDKREIFGALRERVATLSLLILALAFLGILVVLSFWRRRSVHLLTRELALRRAQVLGESRYRRLVENISDALMIDDLAGEVTYVNDRFLDMFGYPRSEVVGRNFVDFCAPEHAETMCERHRRRVAGESVEERFEYEALRKDGSRFWAEVRVSPIVEDGKLIGTQSTIQDISERKRTEKVQAALLSISEAVHASADMDDLYRHIHATVATLLPARNIYVALYDETTDYVSFPYFVDAHDPPPPPQKLGDVSLTALVLRSGQALLLTPEMNRERAENGETIVGTAPIEWLGVPLIASTRVIGVLAVQNYAEEETHYGERDKTLLQIVGAQIATAIERKRAEQNLRESRTAIRNLELALDEHAIVAVTDRQGRLTYVNDKFCEISGYSRDELIGRTHSLLNSRLHPRAFFADLWRTILAGKVWKGEIRNQAKNGRYYWADSTIVPFVDDTGVPYQFVTVRTDVTERKRAEEWQQHYAHTLALITAETPLNEVLASIAGFVESYAFDARCTLCVDDETPGRVVSGPAAMLCGAGMRPARVEPLVAADQRVLGRLLVHSEHGDAFSDELDGLLAQSAALAALAIERSRHQSEQRLARVVFERSVEGVVVVDASDRIVMVNPAFERMTGYSAADVVGRDPGMLDSPMIDSAFTVRIEDALRREDWWQGEYWCRHRSGDNRPTLMSIVLVRDANGAVVHSIRVMADISEQKFQAARIEQLAFYDDLTGLPNRALFLDRLSQVLESARRQGKRGGLLFLDLDRFKEINDSQGHATGDEALKEVAKRFETAARSGEMLARLGGDEFVLLVEDAAHSLAAARAAERLIASLREPLRLPEHTVSVAASIGISLYPDDGENVDDLIKHADIAMYGAKASGGGYRFYKASMGESLRLRLDHARRLQHALEHGGLNLFYQPKVGLASGRITGAEVLLRWHDPVLGQVAPSQFIPLAEERGMIGALGDWVFQATVQQVARWRNAGLEMPGPIAINLSAAQLQNDELLESLMRAVRSVGLDATAFELELTESSMMDDPEHAIATMDALHAAGFSLAIDDFGTGYSSLVYLKRFAADNVKIDMSFVRDMLSDRNDHAIVSTIIAMARGLGLRTTAEGVENAAQAHALLELGCDYAQGWHFGHPLAADEFAARWLQSAIVPAHVEAQRGAAAANDIPMR